VPVYLSVSAFDSNTPSGACAVVTDLTEHQRRVRSILESITDSFFAVDRTWRLTDVNLRGAANFSMARDDLVGRSLWDLSSDSMQSDLEAAYRTAMDDRIAVHIECTLAVAPGRWFDQHIYPTDDGLAVYFRDVTERRHVDEALLNANDRIETILDSVTGNFFGLGPDWRFTYLNKHAAAQIRALGKDPHSLIGKTLWNELPEVANEAALRSVMSDRIPIVDELYCAPLGEWVENHMFPSRDGGLVMFQVYVTERHRAEEQLRRSEAVLAEGQRITHTGSWVWNLTTGELSWSAEHFRICGVDPATFRLTPETARQLIHPDDRVATMEAYDRAVRERANFERELRIIRPEGTIRQVRSLAHPVFSETGELTEFVGTILDITERKKEDETRETLRRRLIGALEDERRRIALDLHDQFGQQLSALTMKLSALKRDCDRRTNFRAELAGLETITRQLDVDLELIVSRLRPPELDDLGLAAAFAHYVKRWSDTTGVRAEWHATGETPGHLTDEMETALYRIGQEALNNVAKHARASNVAVLLDVRSDRASLIIEDDGAGFDLECPTGPRPRFGLNGMRERATLAGGTLDLESVPGKGTTVVARIPFPASAQGGAI
jgi:PAS domain S-box-containing protein